MAPVDSGELQAILANDLGRRSGSRSRGRTHFRRGEALAESVASEAVEAGDGHYPTPLGEEVERRAADLAAGAFSELSAATLRFLRRLARLRGVIALAVHRGYLRSHRPQIHR
jgi:hypothetical protein